MSESISYISAFAMSNNFTSLTLVCFVARNLISPYKQSHHFYENFFACSLPASSSSHACVCAAMIFISISRQAEHSETETSNNRKKTKNTTHRNGREKKVLNWPKANHHNIPWCRQSNIFEWTQKEEFLADFSIVIEGMKFIGEKNTERMNIRIGEANCISHTRHT